jgi:hypothetical protein
LASEAKGRGFDPRQPHQSSLSGHVTSPQKPAFSLEKSVLLVSHGVTPYHEILLKTRHF